MVNSGLAVAISRLILTRNGSRHKTDFESWELGTNQTPWWTVGGKITSQPMPSSRQFWCQVNRRVRSGVYLQHSDSDSINTIRPPPTTRQRHLHRDAAGLWRDRIDHSLRIGRALAVAVSLLGASSSLLCLLCLFSLE